jgi:hypothetical protein
LSYIFLVITAVVIDFMISSSLRSFNFLFRRMVLSIFPFYKFPSYRNIFYSIFFSSFYIYSIVCLSFMFWDLICYLKFWIVFKCFNIFYISSLHFTYCLVYGIRWIYLDL